MCSVVHQKRDWGHRKCVHHSSVAQAVKPQAVLQVLLRKFFSQASSLQQCRCMLMSACLNGTVIVILPCADVLKYSKLRTNICPSGHATQFSSHYAVSSHCFFDLLFKALTLQH